MNNSIMLLDKYKKTCSLASDNACAARLGVSRQAVSKWRHGENHPEVDVIEHMCDATGEPFAKWAHLIEADRARTPDARKAWLRLAQVAAVLMLAIGAPPSRAAARQSTDYASHNPVHSVYYVNMWKALRKLGTGLAWLVALMHGGLRNGATTYTPALAV